MKTVIIGIVKKILNFCIYKKNVQVCVAEIDCCMQDGVIHAN